MPLKGLLARLTALVCLILACPGISSALPAGFYASSSRLSSGKWARIEIRQTGIQLVSNATLRSLGFNDPEKVKVFGFGGRMLPEKLDDTMTDDLPAVPSVRTPRGILFFGHSCISWTPDKNASSYTHLLNPYSYKSYYFLSDCENSDYSPTPANSPEPADSAPITSFLERVVHETDLIAPSNTGRLMLGEDFRAQPERNFQFNLPDIISDVEMTVCFGAKVTNGSSSLLFTANGNRLPATASDRIEGVTSGDTFLATTTTSKTIPDCGDNLNLSVRFSSSGALFTAALDYIRLFYRRTLKLREGELYFYLNPASPSVVSVEGCSGETVIWDVSDVRDIRPVEHTVSGQTATFVTPAGYHEYVAFNPSKAGASVVPSGRVACQNLHAAEAPGMLIITPSAYKEAAQRIASLHEKTDGLTVMTVTPEEIYNEFSSGTPDVTAFRKLLKMWHDRDTEAGNNTARYCLIMSRPTYDNKLATRAVKNAGYPRVPIWQSPSGLSEATSFSSDDYIGMLEDHHPGWDISRAKINVAVGRMPVKSREEALAAADKLENYTTRPQLGFWRNSVMTVADDQNRGDHLLQAEDVWNALRSNGNGAHFVYEKLYLDAYTLGFSATGPVYPEAKQRMFDKLAEGILFWDYIGHASPKGWSHENILTWEDINSMSNRHLPFLYAATCEFMRWDSDDVSGGEAMWLKPDGGVIGMICPTRTVYIALNGPLNEASAQYVFRRGTDGKPMRIGDIMKEGKNARTADSNKLRYALMGDPAMRLPSPEFEVTVDSINGESLADTETMPVLSARSEARLAGRVADAEGNTLGDFNGIVELRLFDAEKVVTTNGNGEQGEVLSYNDRKTRLATAKAEVAHGEWTATLMLPSEIENNYTPALVAAYAFSDDRREANGSTDRLYVYGYDSDAPDDSTGPEFLAFCLDSPSFRDGAAVGPSPVVRATVRDDSGINSSESGIGHGMKIQLDEDTYLNDVSLYFTPDAADPLKGDIAYPLGNLEPGSHSLTLTVWDNANNSSSVSLSFRTEASWRPGISSLSTDANPATANVNFLISVDSPESMESCTVEVFDLSGKKIWEGEAGASSSSADMSVAWNLCGAEGARVARGIYLYRATVTAKSGASSSKSGKLAVAAP